MAEANAYEEMRRRQVEENKRKLDELRLHHLSAAVREAAVKPKPKRKAPASRNAREDAPPRRSGRLASLPEQPNYRKGALSNTSKERFASKEARAYAITKALQIEDELGSDRPIFLKSLYKPMSGWGALCIRKQFCNNHLWVSRNNTISLVDEVDDRVWHALLVYPRNAYEDGCLSDGWSGFANDHNLSDGDCLVFQLVESTKFKVYISRVSSYYDNDDR